MPESGCVDRLWQKGYIQRMIAGLLRILYWAFLAYLVYAVIRFFKKNISRKSQSQETSRQRRAEGLMVKDEVCNTYLPREDAIREIRGGQEYFFCSQECRKKFLESRKAGSPPASPSP